MHHSSEDKVTVHFINRDGETLTTKGKVGDSLLDVVVENNLDIDGFGACEGTLACSTCHLIFEQHIFEKLEAISDEENDMLDLAYGLTDRAVAAGPPSQRVTLLSSSGLHSTRLHTRAASHVPWIPATFASDAFLPCLLLNVKSYLSFKALSKLCFPWPESRLGCQICLTKSMDNMTVRVPEAVADARESIDMGKNSSTLE
ncbi:hypothetical protein CB1_001309004 [Camelus ferus]|nr:hypothetical protein CB1_001309004 [Camelus ferus]